MRIYPAVDIRNGRCVRLRRGSLEDLTDFGDPLEIAQRWKDLGAEYLHVVDLDGAFGLGDNSDIVSRIVSEIRLPVQIGGGIRTKRKIESYLSKGITRVILGTVAIEFPELVVWATRTFPDSIAVGIDARDGKVAVRGWVQETNASVLSTSKRLHEVGAETIIYTDISRDGMMNGPDIQMTEAIVKATGAEVIGSGGISHLQDICALKAAKAAGAVIGRALLDGAFSLEAAIEAGAEHQC